LRKLKQIYELKQKEPVEIAKGKRNFYKMERELEKPRTFLYNVKYKVEYQPVWEKEHLNYLKKGIKVKELVRVDKETEKNIRKWKRLHRVMRVIPNQGVAVSIRDSSIMLTLINSNVQVLIRDKAFIQLMKNLFEVYWNQAKSVNVK